MSIKQELKFLLLITQTSHIPKRVKTFNFLTLNAKIFIP